jgi:hypothetical protein
MDRLLTISIALTVIGALGIAWALPQLANGVAELLGHWWSAATVVVLAAGLTGLVLWSRNRMTAH